MENCSREGELSKSLCLVNHFTKVFLTDKVEIKIIYLVATKELKRNKNVSLRYYPVQR